MPEPPDWERLFAQLAGADGLTLDRSAFGRRDVLQALSAAAGEGATVGAVRAAADRFLTSPRVIRLLCTRSHDVEAQYSTPELLASASRVLDTAAALRSSGRGMAEPEAVDAAIQRRDLLADEQRTTASPAKVTASPWSSADASCHPRSSAATPP